MILFVVFLRNNSLFFSLQRLIVLRNISFLLVNFETRQELHQVNLYHLPIYSSKDERHETSFAFLVLCSCFDTPSARMKKIVREDQEITERGGDQNS